MKRCRNYRAVAALFGLVLLAVLALPRGATASYSARYELWISGSETVYNAPMPAGGDTVNAFLWLGGSCGGRAIGVIAGLCADGFNILEVSPLNGWLKYGSSPASLGFWNPAGAGAPSCIARIVAVDAGWGGCICFMPDSGNGMVSITEQGTGLEYFYPDSVRVVGGCTGLNECVVSCGVAPGPYPCSHVNRSWLVYPDGTGDAPTIQAAIDSAFDGDVVELVDGTFTGAGNRDLDFAGKKITVQSESGFSESCIIDCEGTSTDPHFGFRFISGEDFNSELRDLTILRGYRLGDGGGVFCESNSSPGIFGCRFIGNHGHHGGGISCRSISTPDIENCEFLGNTAVGWGGGVYSTGQASPLLMNCIFRENSSSSKGGAIDARHSDGARIMGSLFQDNVSKDGGAISFDYSDNCSVENSVFYGNVSLLNGGGIASVSSDLLSITGSVFSQNSAAELGGAVYTQGYARALIDRTILAFSQSGEAFYSVWSRSGRFSCSDLYGNAGGDWVGSIAGQDTLDGNFSGDPLFCDGLGGDFTLRSNSPCADGNHPTGTACGQIGPYGVGCGGTTAVERTSWGALKSMFR